MATLESNWQLRGDQKTVEATITVRTLGNTNSTKKALSFECSRKVSWIDRKIHSIFMNAIQGEAHRDLIYNSQCPHNQVTGSCGNRRGALSECRCSTLDRVNQPEIRRNYENKVIKKILELLGQPNPFHLRLAIFCSGQLLGEEILLFRLIHELKARSKTGSIEVFFIDLCYAQAISKAKHNTNFKDSVGKKDYISQFISDFSGCLPPNIELKGTFFDSSESYINFATANPSFKHDLLIGADIENTNVVMARIGTQAGARGIEPITLIRGANAALCELDPIGNLINCYNPEGNGNSSICSDAETESKGETLSPLFSVGSVLVVGLIFFSVLYRLSQK